MGDWITGPNCFGSPVSMMLVLESASVIIDTSVSGSVAWPASSTKMWLKWPRGIPIPSANDEDIQVETMTLKSLILSEGTPKCDGWLSSPCTKWECFKTSADIPLILRDGALYRNSTWLFRMVLSFVVIKSAAALLGAHASIRASVSNLRICRIASIIVLVFPVPNLCSIL